MRPVRCETISTLWTPKPAAFSWLQPYLSIAACR
ncbi:MAG: hypothetical protein AW10_03401 [Candidatus Accumulibacter appositus]|uniref:Uncharacterized protein n=1 Tax=Candidatus Accumulibacter appositus TaxID=1454003 RepID=A0A011QGH1_9PROT|nr:MAG: hypothetical protein AW10_03401 [Candidatus Accumulibacter appositus]